MNDKIKQLHRAKLVPALVSIIFGIALVIARKGAADVAVKIAAVMMMLCGVGSLLMYLFGPVKESMQLGVGAIMAILGALVWVYSGALVDFFPVITGIALILNGMSNLSMLSAYRRSIGSGMVLVFSVLMIAAGIFIIVENNAVLRNVLLIYVGIGYILNGILDVILMYSVKNILLAKSDAIEADKDDSKIE